MRIASDFSCSIESSGTRPISLRYMRTGIVQRQAVRDRSPRPLPRRSASGFSSFCSSSDLDARAVISSKNSSSCSGLMSSSTSKAVLISSYVSEPLALAARDKFFLELLQALSAAPVRRPQRLFYVPSLSALTSFLSTTVRRVSVSPASRHSAALSTSRSRSTIAFFFYLVNFVTKDSNSARTAVGTGRPAGNSSSIDGKGPVSRFLVVELQPLDHPLEMRAPLLRVAVAHRRAAIAAAQRRQHIDGSPASSAKSPKTSAVVASRSAASTIRS